MLLEHGAAFGQMARNTKGRTPFQVASGDCLTCIQRYIERRKQNNLARSLIRIEARTEHEQLQRIENLVGACRRKQQDELPEAPSADTARLQLLQKQRATQHQSNHSGHNEKERLPIHKFVDEFTKAVAVPVTLVSDALKNLIAQCNEGTARSGLRAIAQLCKTEGLQAENLERRLGSTAIFQIKDKLDIVWSVAKEYDQDKGVYVPCLRVHSVDPPGDGTRVLQPLHTALEQREQWVVSSLEEHRIGLNQTAVVGGGEHGFYPAAVMGASGGQILKSFRSNSLMHYHDLKCLDNVWL